MEIFIMCLLIFCMDSPGCYGGGDYLNKIEPNQKPTAVIELILSARNLPNKDNDETVSDAFAVVCLIDPDSDRNELPVVGVTETIQNNLNPDFTTKIPLLFEFSKGQELRIVLWDRDSIHDQKDMCSYNALVQNKKHDLLGFVTVKVSTILTNSEGQSTTSSSVPSNEQKAGEYALQKIVNNMKGKQTPTETVTVEGKNSILIVKYDTIDNTKKDVVMLWKLNEKSPKLKFLIIKKTIRGGHVVTAAATKPEEDWKRIKIVCDDDTALTIECYNYDKGGQHELVGSFGKTIQQLKSDIQCDLMVTNAATTSASKAGKSQTSMGKMKSIGKLLSSSGKSRTSSGKSQTSSGKSLTLIYLQKSPALPIRFEQLITLGMQIECIVAIDFTGSNEWYGHHRPNPEYNGQTAYGWAISKVVPIIEEYDSDKKIPLYGYGFSLNCNVEDCNVEEMYQIDVGCDGAKGVLDKYSGFLQKIRLSGPTKFQPVIKKALDEAKAMQEKEKDPDKQEKYLILMILTDGIMDDKHKTKEVIIEASHYPTSIIIIGIGIGNGGKDPFKEMNELDGDRELLSWNGKKAVRDIVQFVSLEECKKENWSLSQEVLAEIPDQVMEYMKLKRRRFRVY